MSDETTTPEVEGTEATESTETAEETKTPGSATFRHPLSRDTDHAVRPGFRSPANQGSKAQKKSKRR